MLYRFVDQSYARVDDLSVTGVYRLYTLAPSGVLGANKWQESNSLSLSLSTLSSRYYKHRSELATSNRDTQLSIRGMMDSDSFGFVTVVESPGGCMAYRVGTWEGDG